MISYTLDRPSYIVSLAEAKSWIRIDHSADDSLIENVIIPAAQAMIEQATGLCFTDETEVVAVFDVTSNATGWIELPFSPLQEIDTVEVNDEASESYAINGADYYPTMTVPSGTKVKVTYTAGMATPDPDCKLAVLQQAAYIYANRETTELAESVRKFVLLRGRNLAI